MSNASPRENIDLGEDLTLYLDGEECWPDLAEKGYRVGKLKSVAALLGATSDGRPAVTFRAELEDGTTVLLQTTMRLFTVAARAFAARFESELA